MLRCSTAALLAWDAPVEKLLMLPFSESASSLLSRLCLLSSKVSRFRHHIINLQTYLSSNIPPESLLPKPRSAFILNETEESSWTSARASAGTKFCRIALRAARRHLWKSQALFRKTAEELGAIHPLEAAQIKLRVQNVVARLEASLLRTRTKKWERGNVQPKPFFFPRKRGTRGGKRHTRSKRKDPHVDQSSTGNQEEPESPAVEAFINSFHSGVRPALRSSGPQSLPDNLTPEERTALTSLSKRTDIIIKPADKGAAVVVLDRTDYDKEAERKLLDSSRYEVLNSDPTRLNNETINKAVDELLAKNSINRNTANDLKQSRPRTASFYLLPKVHKSLSSPPGRPIVSSNGCPTELISAFVDTILKPLVTNVPSFIRDTKHLLSEILSLPKLPSHALLVTMDVVGLYSNIPHSDGADACREFLAQRPVCVPATEDVLKLIHLVLDMNCFTFQGKHYRQTLGTAMGTRMAPSFANLFMAALEKKILATAPDIQTPEFFKRFIDGLLIVWLHGEESLLRFFDHANRAHPSIQFTMDYGRSVHYLDATLAIEDNGRISSDLFTKPTDSHQYLFPSSNHPPHVHDHLPYGLALRIRQIVSSDDRLRTRLAELRDFLLDRGYNEVAIQEQFERAAGVPRQQALQKRRRVTNDRVPLVCSWNERLPDLGRILRQYFPVLQSEASLEQCFTAPPLLSFRRPRNLRDILVYGTQKNTSAQDAPIGTHKCLHSRCRTCPIVNNITQIQTNSGLKHIRDSFTCDTSSLVYVITCSKCNSVCVGETGQKLRERMNGHRADIKNKNNTPVGLHFNAKGHEPRISGLQKTAQDTTARRVREKKWIKLLESCKTYKCMNRDSGIYFLIL